MPTPQEIAALCREIRERGFRDRGGNWHQAWSDEELRDRAGGRMLEARAVVRAKPSYYGRIRLRARVIQRRLLRRTFERIATGR